MARIDAARIPGSTALSALSCAELSESLEEPIAGTAACAQIWIGLEEPGPWERKALQSAGLATLRETLQRWLEIPGSRLQLIRRPGENRSCATRRVFVARVGERPKLVCTELDDTSLTGFDPMKALDELPDAPPVHWVCTHGRRDRCCAIRGVSLFNAMRTAGANVWQTSHLGGHRFAATCVSFPSGLCHGRIRPEDVESAAACLVKSESPGHAMLRGRVSHEAKAQAAEVALLKHAEIRALDAEPFAFVGSEPHAGFERLSFSRQGTQHHVHVSPHTQAARAKSCGDEPKPVTSWVATVESS